MVLVEAILEEDLFDQKQISEDCISSSFALEALSN